MANVVSSKYGDRELINLPPVSLDKDRTTGSVSSLLPRQYGTGRSRTSGANYSRAGYTGSVYPDRYQTANVPRAYAPPRRSGTSGYPGTQWTGGPLRQKQGNLVPDHVAFQPQQQSQYPVLPPTSGMTYTPHAMAQVVQPGQQQVVQQILPTGQVVAQPYQGQVVSQPYQGQVVGQPYQGQVVGQPYQGQVGGQQVQGQYVVQGQPNTGAPAVQTGGPAVQGNDPNEKHIYYGPNGEILPGPPGPQRAPVGMIHENPRNFTVEGVLEFGVLTTLSLLDGTSSFPQIPPFLRHQLRQKYGEFERTVVTIISTNGELQVHAAPQIPGPEIVPVPVDPVMVYGPDFYSDPDPLPQQPSNRQYRTPAVLERSYPFDGFDHAGHRRNLDRRYRESNEDPMSEFRWNRQQESA